MSKIEQKIPEGWSVKKILDVCPLQRGFDLPEQNIVAGNYPIVYSNGIKGTHNEYKAKAPGVVTGRSGTIGKVTYVEKDYWPHNTSLWVTDFKGNNPKFIFYKIQNLKFAKFNSGSGVPTLNRNDVHIEKILLPPLQEQEKIADILGTWDEAIEKLSSLIEHKKLLKKGLMQKLLTGKTRLKGFTQPWKEVKLGEILVERNEYTTQNNQVTILTSSRKGIFRQEDYFDKQVASENNIGYKILHKYDFTYRAMTDDDVYCFNQLTNEDMGAVSPAYSVFYCENVPNLLIKEILNSKCFGHQLLKISQGGTRKSLKFSALKTLKIYIPSDINEQQVIAVVLSTADDEISLLNQKLEALKEQKKGLMQQLLTGQTRVKVN